MNNFISKARFITLGLAVSFLPFSVRFCHLFLLLFMVACLAEGDFINKIRLIKQNPLAWVLPVFFLLHLVGVFYSGNASNAWSNVDKKIAFALAPLIVVPAKPFTKDEIRKVAWLFVAACIVGTAICLVNAFVVSKTNVPLWNFGPEQPYLALHPGASSKWPYFSYIGLASGIGIHPTYFAFYLLVCVLIVLRTVPKTGLMMALIVYLLIFIVLLSSRIVVIATAFTLLISAVNKKVLIVGAVVMIAVILINPLALYRNAEEYTRSSFTWPPQQMSDNPISIRMSLLWLTGHAVRETNPLIGTGTGDVDDTIAGLQERYDVHNTINTSDPHNQYLHTYIALGILGLISLMVVFLMPLWMLFRQREFLVCAGVISFMLVCMTESALELQKGIVLFAISFSIIGNQVRVWSFGNQQFRYA